VGSEITKAVFPLDFRIGAALAVNVVFCGLRLAATLTGFNDRIAGATIIATTSVAHEKTFSALFDRLTAHGLYLLLLAYSGINPLCMKKKAHSISRP
jgi:hypothetical protein